MTEEELCIKLKENYEYNPETGLVTRIKAINGLKVGHVVTTKNATGYVKIGLLNKTYMAHRLAFLYMTGF